MDTKFIQPNLNLIDIYILLSNPDFMFFHLISYTCFYKIMVFKITSKNDTIERMSDKCNTCLKKVKILLSR